MSDIKELYIGVDGGATSCKVRIEDGEGNLVGTAIGKPANIRYGVCEAWNNILETIESALKSTGIALDDTSVDFHVGCGLAGTEVKSACDEFLSYRDAFNDLCLESDAYAACMGAHAGEDGGVVIIGTGVVGMNIQNNIVDTVGGWGFPHSDEGGGAWLGMLATGLALKAYDGRIQKSALTDAILAKYSSINSFVEFAVSAKSTQFAELAPIVVEHYKNGDRCANYLMEKATTEIEMLARALRKRSLEPDSFRLSLVGGIAPFIEELAGRSLKEVLVPRKFDSAKGAIFMVKKYMKNKDKTNGN